MRSSRGRTSEGWQHPSHAGQARAGGSAGTSSAGTAACMQRTVTTQASCLCSLCKDAGATRGYGHSPRSEHSQVQLLAGVWRAQGCSAALAVFGACQLAGAR